MSDPLQPPVKRAPKILNDLGNDLDRVFKSILDRYYVSSADKETWTPTWTGFTLGNGTQTAYYKTSGHVCRFRVDVIFGSTSSFSGGQAYFNLPVQDVGMMNRASLGLASFHDVSASIYCSGIAMYFVSGTNGYCSVRCLDTSGAYAVSANPTTIVPFTWATNDRFMVEGWYFV
ncbi:MAG: hypothetical protein HY864_00745 [Chloroflexi bacterium]|nr:hypothetical protein [Chloroflexota bacterium]